MPQCWSWVGVLQLIYAEATTPSERNWQGRSSYLFVFHQVVYKNNDIRLELSRLARIMDPKMKLQGDVVFKCENVPTLDPINFEMPESYLALPKWNTKRVGSISFDFRTSEPNGLILFTHGKPQDRRDVKGQKNNKVDFFAVELLDGGLYLLLDMGSGTIKVKATQTKVNDGTWHHVDIQRDGRSGKNEGGNEGNLQLQYGVAAMI